MIAATQAAELKGKIQNVKIPKFQTERILNPGSRVPQNIGLSFVLCKSMKETEGKTVISPYVIDVME